MQTPSHFLITAFIGDKTKHHAAIPPQLSAALLGSVLPDIPFALLTLAGEVYYRWFAPLPVIGVSIMEYLHLTLFYTDPIWIVAHNFFHSLVINSVFVGTGYWIYLHHGRWGRFLLWLGISMLFHTTIDVLTHSSDGPLLFFPLNWSYRFHSPVSYWEAAHYGRIFMAFEYLLDIIIVAYFARRWWRRRRSALVPTTKGGEEAK